MSRWSDRLNSSTLVPSYNIDLVKARLKSDEPVQGIKTYLENPLDTNGATGFKDRKYSLDFQILREIPSKSGFIAAIIQTRTNQVASFAVPYKSTKSVGYQIKHRNASKVSTKGEREMISNLENYIYSCGFKEQNPHNSFKRDNFKTFLSKSVRDTLTLDQVAWEIVPSKSGIPYEFLAVDAATIRLASADFGSDSNPDTWRQTSNISTYGSKAPAYVQLVNGSIQNVYSMEELAFGVRNHRTDLYIAGYGYSELEMLLNTITAHLNAETYNSVFFKQGSSPKGMINFKGDSMSPDQLEGFRRMWRDQMEGVNSFWRTPIIQSEGGVDWIDFRTNNRDMEFGQWLEYLIKISSSVFGIDPAELNFDLSGGVTQTPLFESSQEWKLKASKDKGLRPLLSFFENMINENIIHKIDDDYVFQFVGLDELTEEQKIEQRIKQSTSYMTINEIRRAEDLPDIDGGDIINNPTYVQSLQMKQQAEQQKMQMAQQQQPPQAQTYGEVASSAQQEQDTNDHVPDYVS